MQIPNLTLAYQIAELSPLLEGSILRKVQELPNEWLKLKLQTRQGTKDLIISPNAFFIALQSLPAKHQSSGFGAFLKKRLANKRILSIKQHSLDRIMLLEFDDYFLVLELFAKGNVILITKEMEIVSAYRKEQWKDRAVRKSEPYKFPSSKGASPLETTASKLHKTFKESDSDCIRALVSALNIAPVAGEEACLLAGIDKAKPAAKAGKPELEALLGKLKTLYKVSAKKLSPGLALDQLLPFEFKAAGEFSQRFDSINQAIESHFSKEFNAAKPAVRQESKQEQKLERNLANQLAAVGELEQKAESAKQAAEAIYANYNAVNAALRLGREFAEGKTTKKEIMYKLDSIGFKLSGIDLKNKKIKVEIK